MLPRIEKPCPKNWDSLTGDGRRRFCEQCGLHVHNLSAMSRSEVVEFMRGSERKCGAYLEDTRIPKVQTSVWKFLDWAKLLRPALAGTAIAVSVLGTGCTTTRHTLGAPEPSAKSEPQKEPKKTIPVEELDPANYKVGVIEEPRPLWQRILWPFGGY